MPYSYLKIETKSFLLMGMNHPPVVKTASTNTWPMSFRDMSQHTSNSEQQRYTINLHGHAEPNGQTR